MQSWAKYRKYRLENLGENPYNLKHNHEVSSFLASQWWLYNTPSQTTSVPRHGPLRPVDLPANGEREQLLQPTWQSVFHRTLRNSKLLGNGQTTIQNISC